MYEFLARGINNIRMKMVTTPGTEDPPRDIDTIYVREIRRREGIRVDDETGSVNQRRTSGSRKIPNYDFGRAPVNNVTLPAMINIESSRSGRIGHQMAAVEECDAVDEGDTVGVEDMETHPELVTLVEVVEVEPEPASPVEDMVFQPEPAVNDDLLDNNQAVE